MTLAELIRSVSWPEVESLIPRFPHEPELNVKGYRHVFDELHRLRPAESRMRIVVQEHFDSDFDEAPVLEVLGRNGQLNRDQEDVRSASSEMDEEWLDSETDFALSLTPWEEWLGMQIDPNSLARYSEAEIVAQCLWDMTFHGFEQDQVRDTLTDLKRRIGEIDAMTPEEREMYLIPAEEVFRMLDREQDEEE
jgi:hypothetical protein